jgi:NAD(P)-dependent dehydrogenase (short-subunit alcohol dehydrogenase family)
MSNLSTQGKICLVTGASSGIGKATALGLAKLGATVVMVCRDANKGEAALSEIKRKSGSSSVDLLLADLSSQKAMRRLANEYESKYQQLHVLINNAGVYYTKRHVTVDGLEAMFAINYLARFLLTNLLLDIIKQSAPARIINVAGAYHAKGKIAFDDLQGEKDFDGQRANHQSKLADVLFTYELARRLEGTGVTVNCLHPGMVATDLIDKDKDFPVFFKYLYKLSRSLMKSPAKGAETSLYLASSPEVEGITGQYFVNKKISPSSPESHDIQLAKRLWEVSEKLAKLA